MATSLEIRETLVDALELDLIGPSLEAEVLENLQLYERGQPCRTPFREDELP